MDEQVLSIEQMQELIELGIDTSEATCYWYIKANHITKGWDKPELCTKEPFWPAPPNKVIPTFTLQDILVILSNIKEYVWVLNESGIILEDLKGNEFHREHHGNLIQTAFNMLKWCKENGHI